MHRLVVLVVSLALAFGLLPQSALAIEGKHSTPPGQSGHHRRDNRTPNPLAEKQFKLKQKALEMKLEGKVKGNVVEVGKGQFVELALEKTDHIFTVLVEFGGPDGPLHNQIEEPDRSTDNTTYWVPDFNREHYEEMLFSREPGANSMANYYLEQSSGRYTVDGVVTDWVRLSTSEWEYGRNEGDPAPEDTVYRIVGDAIAQWTEDQVAAGRSLEEIREYLKQFDVWDRYDHDADGNFDEPDGYIDHFQIIHAGEGEEAGGGAQGSDAIWSHRWYANFSAIGSAGPSDYALFGGYEFPGTDIWVGDYTIEPENGGVGVFAHEFAHDLGLPDEYDTSYTGESSAGFWTLMASGSWLGDGKDSIGTRPNHMNAWDKLMLGWLDYDIARAGVRSTHRIGPAETTTKAAQALITILPKREHTVSVNTPYAGDWEWWSDMGDDLDNTLTRSVDLPAASEVRLDLYAWYDIEEGWDYAYVQVSADGGATWTNLASSITTNDNPHGQNQGNGITGNSGGWVPASFDLTPYAGQSILLRFRYWTDGAVQGKGFAADEIAIVADGSTIFADGAETEDAGWTADGFLRFQGTSSALYNNYYIAEFRQYRGYDETLQTGPYNFPNPGGKWVEHFPYQDGLLISYWDTFYRDNNVGQHPGGGLILPIDAHPEPLLRADGTPWRTRVQVFDATFGIEPTDPITLSSVDELGNLVAVTYDSLPAARVFNDLNDYWFASKPDAGVKVPKTGTVIEVVRYNTQGQFMEVRVYPAK